MKIIRKPPVNRADNKLITVPNSSVVGNNIINYDSLATRRIDIVLSVAYGSDIEKCKSVFRKVVDSHELILKTPEPAILLTEYGASSINFTVRAWVRKGNYGSVKFELMEKFYLAMNENGIEIDDSIPEEELNRMDVKAYFVEDGLLTLELGESIVEFE